MPSEALKAEEHRYVESCVRALGLMDLIHGFGKLKKAKSKPKVGEGSDTVTPPEQRKKSSWRLDPADSLEMDMLVPTAEVLIMENPFKWDSYVVLLFCRAIFVWQLAVRHRYSPDCCLHVRYSFGTVLWQLHSRRAPYYHIHTTTRGRHCGDTIGAPVNRGGVESPNSSAIQRAQLEARQKFRKRIASRVNPNILATVLTPTATAFGTDSLHLLGPVKTPPATPVRSRSLSTPIDAKTKTPNNLVPSPGDDTANDDSNSPGEDEDEDDYLEEEEEEDDGDEFDDDPENHETSGKDLEAGMRRKPRRAISLTPSMVGLLRALLAHDPRNRPSISEVCPLLQDYLQQIQSGRYGAGSETKHVVAAPAAGSTTLHQSLEMHEAKQDSSSPGTRVLMASTGSPAVNAMDTANFPPRLPEPSVTSTTCKPEVLAEEDAVQKTAQEISNQLMNVDVRVRESLPVSHACAVYGQLCCKSL